MKWAPNAEEELHTEEVWILVLVEWTVREFDILSNGTCRERRAS